MPTRQAEYEWLRDGDWPVGDPDRVTPEVLDQELYGSDTVTLEAL